MTPTETADELLRREIEKVKSILISLGQPNVMTKGIIEIYQRNLGCLETILRDREALNQCKAMVEHHLAFLSAYDEHPNAWPDLLTGCESGGGINDALTHQDETITRLLE